jgi:hypothetical protein
LWVPGKIVGQELERDKTVQARVFRFVNHAHTAATNEIPINMNCATLVPVARS